MIILTGKKRKMGQARKKTSETEKSTGKKEKPTNATQISNFFKAVFLYPPKNVMVNSLHNAPGRMITNHSGRVESGADQTRAMLAGPLVQPFADFINSIL